MKKIVHQSFVAVLAVTLAICVGQCFQVESIVDPGFLEPHNKARAAVGVAPLDWSPEVAKLAAYSVNRITNETTCFTFTEKQDIKWFIEISKKYGMNGHYTERRSTRIPSAVQIVEEWVAGKKFYNYSNNSCSAYDRYTCYPYKRVVWRESQRLGCALADCTKYGDNAFYRFFGICLYIPGGEPSGTPY